VSALLLAGFGLVAIALGVELGALISGHKPMLHPGMLYALGPVLFGLGCLREALFGHRRPAPVRVAAASRPQR
jgi:hypothetical protein